MDVHALASKLLQRAGELPGASRLLRRLANLYREGSVVSIRTGHAAGIRWRRRHRYVNGYWLGHYELPIQEALVRLLRPGAVFYDVGANAGFFTALAARLVGPEGQVYSFEPLPENLEALRDLVALNGFRQCEIVPRAVGREEGEAEFHVGPGGNAEAHLGDKRDGGESTLRVTLTCLDAFLADHRAPDLVKIDVEGAEADVLAGAERLLCEGTTLLIELHGHAVARTVAALLRERGYEFETLDGGRQEEPEAAHHFVARRAGGPATARAASAKIGAGPAQAGA